MKENNSEYVPISNAKLTHLIKLTEDDGRVVYINPSIIESIDLLGPNTWQAEIIMTSGRASFTNVFATKEELINHLQELRLL